MSMQVQFFDVGDCHSTYLAFSDTTKLLIDTGAGERSTAQYLETVWTLHQVVVTHPHADHIKSLAEIKPKVQRFYSIKTSYYPRPCSTQDKPNFDAYYLLRQLPTGIEATKGLVLRDDDPILVELLAPAAAPASTATSDELNEASAIVFVRYRDRNILITGDNGQESLRQFTKDWKPFAADILLAPHHGQKSGFLTEFVQHVNPGYVIISSGSVKNCDAYDDYARYARHGVRTTRKYGTITFTMNDDGTWTSNAA